MKKLNEKIWKPYQINEVFNIEPGVRLEARNRNEGKRPFIGALDNSNGVVQFVNNNNKSLDSNFLGVNYNGNGMGIGFYHPYQCVCTDDVKRFHLKYTVDSEELALFNKTAIEKQRNKFGYLYKFNTKRMSKTSILLPVDNAGNVDYKYMTSYIKEKRKEMLERYKRYIIQQISHLEYKKIPTLEEKEWKHFLIPNIFKTIQRGKRLKNADHIPGTIPYVSSTANNNGVDDYIEASQGTRVFKNCISLANSGSVGTAFYEPFEFVASDHVTSLKIPQASKFIYLFLVSVIEKQKSNFNFNREINDQRIRKMQIMLPVTADGSPDYTYMKQYAENMMLKKYKQYIAFLDRKK